MKVRTAVLFECECGAFLRVEVRKLEEAVQKAVSAGWVVLGPGIIEYCPSCVERGAALEVGL